MYRHIAFYKFNVKDTFKEGEDRVQSIWLTRAMCNVLGYTFKEQTECMGVNGCGMDMGFSVIHNLGHELFGDGYKLTSKGFIIIHRINCSLYTGWMLLSDPFFYLHSQANQSPF